MVLDGGEDQGTGDFLTAQRAISCLGIDRDRDGVACSHPHFAGVGGELERFDADRSNAARMGRVFGVRRRGSGKRGRNFSPGMRLRKRACREECRNRDEIEGRTQKRSWRDVSNANNKASAEFQAKGILGVESKIRRSGSTRRAQRTRRSTPRISRLPSISASWRASWPAASFSLGSAPYSRSSFTIAICPPAIAAMSGVFAITFWATAFTLAPLLIRSLTMPLCP